MSTRDIQMLLKSESAGRPRRLSSMQKLIVAPSNTPAIMECGVSSGNSQVEMEELSDAP